MDFVRDHGMTSNMLLTGCRKAFQPYETPDLSLWGIPAKGFQILGEQVQIGCDSKPRADLCCHS